MKLTELNFPSKCFAGWRLSRRYRITLSDANKFYERFKASFLYEAAAWFTAV